ncbi:DUF4395 family protein [Tichowtungia aerotolerans]|uniref:DUF4395 family protein n=1 Tax=Tichowtungia aerotolerans TaxID=2697043 RepID=A0A6P1M3Y8_9BACT|nr:DUF4395 family protein [Tichowtungia aerotolerans]QHI68557.1 DUF4395 family protein [Tichowtungia aerotolerans]
MNTLNKSVVRITAFLTVLLLLGGLFSMLKWVALILCFDALIRGFTNLPISPLHRAARAQSKILRRGATPVDAAPYRFAARIGFAVYALITLLAFTGLIAPARILTQLMVLAAGVEAFAGINIWGKVYTLLHKSR